MIGERLAELRKLNGETQEDLAKAFHVSVPTVRTWERDKASPSHEVLIALCKRYGTSADYLLGLTDIDPSDEHRKQQQKLTHAETKCTTTKNICCGNETKTAAQRDREGSSRCAAVAIMAIMGIISIIDL